MSPKPYRDDQRPRSKLEMVRGNATCLCDIVSCSGHIEAGVTLKAAAEDFPQGNTPNPPELGLTGIPKREALKVRVLSPKHCRRLQCPQHG
jgi:hypothetical protein